MNKQQLANKIWASANKMRSKIDANEYKDYIGAPDKPCGVVCADVNPKTVAKRYMIVQKVVSLHYESEWQ